MLVPSVPQKIALFDFAILLLLQICVKGEIQKYGNAQIEIYPSDNQLAYYSLPTPSS